MPRSPESRSLAARIGAHVSWANTTDRTARTAPARSAMLERFEREVDPNGTLAPAERARRAEHARKAYFLGLALKSAQARRERRRRNSAATEAAELRALADEIDASGGAA